MISIIRQFHDGVQACVHLESSDVWMVGAHKGFRRGCVLPAGLIGIFSPAVLTMAFDCF